VFKTVFSYFKAIDSYVLYYCKRATLRFWLWKIRMDMKELKLTEDEVSARLKKVYKCLNAYYALYAQ
jgi:hypothetical protein